MSGVAVPILAALAAVNLVALLALALAGRDGRKHRRAPEAAVAGVAEAKGEAAPVLEGDPLEALVCEVEEAESAARGEAKLAEDIARWRRRFGGGRDLPGAATSGHRPASSVA